MIVFFVVGTALLTKYVKIWYRLQINPYNLAGIFKSTDNSITWLICEKFKIDTESVKIKSVYLYIETTADYDNEYQESYVHFIYLFFF